MSNNLYYSNRSVLTLYINAKCNLNCSYCYINKNPSLQKLDREIGDLYKTDYYVDFAKEIFTNQEELKRVDFWGGEPLLSITRISDTFEKLIRNFPNLYRTSFSTNFTHDLCIPELIKLLNIYRKFPNRKFKLMLQISIDGDSDITDVSRGKDVTKRILSNFDKLMVAISEDNIVPDNVILDIFTKSTIASSNFDLLNNKDYLIKYFQFFENNFLNKINNLNKENVTTFPAVYNFVSPSAYTQEDGIKLKDICKLSREIEKENAEKKYFKYYKIITPLANFKAPRHNSCVDYCYRSGCCGLGIHTVGLLPNDYICVCHRAFTAFTDDYAKDFVINKDATVETRGCNLYGTQMLFHKNELPEFVKKIETFLDSSSRNYISSIAIAIKMLAMAGHIDEKYNDEFECIRGAKNIVRIATPCLYCNEAMSGSLNLYHSDELRLFLNGAIDYIMEDFDE